MELVLIDDKEWLVSEEAIAVLDQGRVPEGMKVSGDIIIRIGPGRYYSWVKSPFSDELFKTVTEVKGYEDLTRILNEALEQATSGKGKERHAGGKPFDKQPIMEIARMTGLAYQTGQAMKKIQESHTLLEIKGKEAAINELRGAIIYLAAAIKTIEEN